MKIITQTPRLKLVEFTANDVDLYFQLTSNQEVMKFFEKTLTYEETKEELERIVRFYTEHGYCFWKVLLKANDQFIGICGLLHQMIDNQAEAEIAYRLLPEYWGQGYATEAAKATQAYAENELGITRLISLILPDNRASQKVARRLGAVKEKSLILHGLEHDLYLY